MFLLGAGGQYRWSLLPFLRNRIKELIQVIAYANQGQGLSALGVILRAMTYQPVVKQFPEKLLLVAVGRDYIKSINTVGFCGPGNIMDIQVRDGRAYCFPVFVDNRVMNKGQIYPGLSCLLFSHLNFYTASSSIVTFLSLYISIFFHSIIQAVFFEHQLFFTAENGIGQKSRPFFQGLPDGGHQPPFSYGRVITAQQYLGNQVPLKFPRSRILGILQEPAAEGIILRRIPAAQYPG